jgi:hypothetical protein
MADKTQSKGNIKPQDPKIHIKSMEIPPQKPKTTSSNTPSTSKPATKK